MTCIVGLVHEHRVYMGADSVGGDTSRYAVTIRADPKLFTLDDGKIIIGFTSSFRMGQILKYHMKIRAPDPSKTPDLEQWMFTTFIEEARELMGKYGYRKKDNEREEGGTFMVGMYGRLFTVESDFQLAVPRLPFAAVGCGDQIALGSLYSTHQSNLLPDKRVALAIEAASEFNAYVRKPILLINGTVNPNPPVVQQQITSQDKK